MESGENQEQVYGEKSKKYGKIEIALALKIPPSQITPSNLPLCYSPDLLFCHFATEILAVIFAPITLALRLAKILRSKLVVSTYFSYVVA